MQEPLLLHLFQVQFFPLGYWYLLGPLAASAPRQSVLQNSCRMLE